MSQPFRFVPEPDAIETTSAPRSGGERPDGRRRGRRHVEPRADGGGNEERGAEEEDTTTKMDPRPCAGLLDYGFRRGTGK